MPPINVSGVDLMKRINDGLIQKAPTEYIQQVRAKITESCEELIDFGARIRPLVVDKKQVGWVRGVHYAERKVLERWAPLPNDFIYHTLRLATSFTPEELENFSAVEIHYLAAVVQRMSEYDMSLYPYLSAFVTTMSSENLWHGKGTLLSSFENKKVTLPDGHTMEIMKPPDHTRLWATLCTYREQAKKRLDENFNAVLIVRPWAGKSVDPISSELKAMSRQLQTDSFEPWQNIIKVESSVDVNDGWAHSDDTREGIVRELKGMLNNDRHEQLIATFEKQQREAAEERQNKLNKMVEDRGGPGIFEEHTEVITEQEVLRRQRALKKGIPSVSRDREVTEDPQDKIKRYQ
jgi:hypothetical protein